MKYFDRCASHRWYSINSENRHYHNWAHARRVVFDVKVIDKDASEELILAAYWHDAVYISGAGSDANERCSAAALGMYARDVVDPVAIAIVKEARQLILCTTIETHLNDKRITGDLATLLDADLRSLSDTYEEFLATQKNIILENGGTYPKDQHLSAAFLKQFLECREFIYHTDYARLNWEQIARANIKRYSKEPLTN